MADENSRDVFMQELREKLLAYDRKHGPYKESEFEGFSVWRFLTLADPDEPFSLEAFKAWEEELGPTEDDDNGEF